jgi:hypothetical protein
MRLPVGSAFRVFAIGALAAFSLPGVHAARAEADLVPPAKQLFAFDARAPAPAPRQAAPTSCGAGQVAAMRMADARREAAMARIAELVGAGPGGDAEVLNGRGLAYPVRRDPNVELLRVQREAQRLRGGAPAR